MILFLVRGRRGTERGSVAGTKKRRSIEDEDRSEKCIKAETTIKRQGDKCQRKKKRVGNVTMNRRSTSAAPTGLPFITCKLILAA